MPENGWAKVTHTNCLLWLYWWVKFIMSIVKTNPDNTLTSSLDSSQHGNLPNSLPCTAVLISPFFTFTVVEERKDSILFFIFLLVFTLADSYTVFSLLSILSLSSSLTVWPWIPSSCGKAYLVVICSWLASSKVEPMLCRSTMSLHSEGRGENKFLALPCPRLM